MSDYRCPGQDMRFWKPSDVSEAKCPACGTGIEFWKDDPFRRCPKCNKAVVNSRHDLGCAQWCERAEECLATLRSGSDERPVCERLVSAMKDVFGADERRIAHALNVLEHAEAMLDLEDGSPLVVKAAAILHDIGIREAERKHGSAAGRYQEVEGPPIAREIMERMGLDEADIGHVCRIISNHHSDRDIDTPEFRILWDADWLVNIPEEFSLADKGKLEAVIENVFKTGTGRDKAYKLFVGQVAAARTEGPKD